MNYESEIPAGLFKSYQLGGGSCLHHLLPGRLVKVVVFGRKSLFKDLRGDIASWEKEDGWETSGEVRVVTLRCLS